MTVLELITGSLRLLGVVAEGENPSNESAADALESLNLLLDSWGLGACVHSTQTQEISWPSGTASLSVGPSGDVVGERPISVLPSTYYNDGDLDSPLFLVDEREYHALALKDLGAPPHSLWVNYTYPDVILTLYPVPTEALTLYLRSNVAIDRATALTQTLVLPTGYNRALKHELAIELAPEYGVEPSPTLQRRAWHAVRVVKRTNMKNMDKNKLFLPSGLTRTRTNIYEG